MGGGDTTEEEEEESDGGVGRSGAKSVSSSGALMASIVEHEEVWEDFDEGEVMDDEDQDDDDEEEDQDEGKGGVGGEAAGDSKADPKRNLREGSHKGSLKEDSSSEEDEEDADQWEGGGGAGAFARALQQRKRKRKSGKAQSITGGLMCAHCGTTTSKGWERLPSSSCKGVNVFFVLDRPQEGPDSDGMVDVCRKCGRHWRASHVQTRALGHVRSVSQIRRSQREELSMLRWTSHSSWGDLDLLRVAPFPTVAPAPSTNGSSKEGGTGADDLPPGGGVVPAGSSRLLYNPLPHELAVGFSSNAKGSDTSISKAGGGSNAQHSAWHCIHDSKKPSINNEHVRNLVSLQRQCLLASDVSMASHAASALLSQRRLIPDVCFKSSYEALRGRPTACLRMLRRFVEVAPSPARAVATNVELVRYMIECGRLNEARVELRNRLESGRPYSESLHHRHTLASLNMMLLVKSLRDKERLAPASPGGCGQRSKQRARVAGSTGGSSSRGSGWGALEEGGSIVGNSHVVLDVFRCGLLRIPGGREMGSCDWVLSYAEACAIGKDKAVSGRIRSGDLYREGVVQAKKAMSIEALPATLGLLSLFLCVGGEFDQARELVVTAVEAKPPVEHSWRMMACMLECWHDWEEHHGDDAYSPAPSPNRQVDAGKSRAHRAAGHQEKGSCSEPGRRITLVDAVEGWIRCDPASREALALMIRLWDGGKGPVGSEMFLEGLLGALDYPQGESTDLMELLIGAIPKLPAILHVYSPSEISHKMWDERCQWWPKLHGAAVCDRIWPRGPRLPKQKHVSATSGGKPKPATEALTTKPPAPPKALFPCAIIPPRGKARGVAAPGIGAPVVGVPRLSDSKTTGSTLSLFPLAPELLGGSLADQGSRAQLDDVGEYEDGMSEGDGGARGGGGAVEQGANTALSKKRKKIGEESAKGSGVQGEVGHAGKGALGWGAGGRGKASGGGGGGSKAGGGKEKASGREGGVSNSRSGKEKASSHGVEGGSSRGHAGRPGKRSGTAREEATGISSTSTSGGGGSTVSGFGLGQHPGFGSGLGTQGGNSDSKKKKMRSLS